MTMHRNLILLVFLLLLISINGQDDGDRDLPKVRQAVNRASKVLFDTQFQRGRCPHRFYQLGDECVYLATDGKIYSWKQAERACSRRIARMLNDQSSSTSDQPNMQPTKGVRQLVLNTPDKTELFRVLYREYEEQNFAVRLPSDYNTLQRCRDGKDDKWPYYCTDPQSTNSTCFETTASGQSDICLREVECTARYLRLACEFTLPGSPELTDSKFRNCPKVYGRNRLLPMWAWIAIIIGTVLALLGILIAVITLIRKSKANAASKKKPLPEPRQTDEKVIQVSTKREDPAAEPMLIRATPTNISDTNYLEPQPSPRDNTANA